MRVAFIHSGYSRHLVSGIIRVENELVKELRRLGHTAEIMPWSENAQRSLVSQQYMRIVRPAAFIYQEIKNFIKEGKFDLVVLPGVGYPETRILPMLKRSVNARFIVMQHGWPTHTPASRLLINSYMQAAGYIFLAEADYIIAVSKYVIDNLEDYIDPERSCVIYPGVDTQIFKPVFDKTALHKKWQIKQRFVLLGNGKLTSLKNYLTLLKALPFLPDCELLLIGSGSRTKEQWYKSFVKENKISDRVRFLGTLPNQQLPELYNLADVFVHPSKSEALGIVLLEALATKTPVVAAEVGGVPEVIKNGYNGLLYQDPKDYKLLADNIRKLLDNQELRKKFGENGRQTVLEKFDWKKILPQYLKVFENTLKLPPVKSEQAEGPFGAFA